MERIFAAPLTHFEDYFTSNTLLQSEIMLNLAETHSAAERMSTTIENLQTQTPSSIHTAIQKGTRDAIKAGTFDRKIHDAVEAQADDFPISGALPARTTLMYGEGLESPSKTTSSKKKVS